MLILAAMTKNDDDYDDISNENIYESVEFLYFFSKKKKKIACRFLDSKRFS